MNSDVRKRKKRFWAVSLALVLALVQVVPVDVYSTRYELTISESGSSVLSVDFLKDGDEISFLPSGNYSVSYYDIDGKTSLNSSTYRDLGTRISLTISGYSVIKDHYGTTPPFYIGGAIFRLEGKKNCGFKWILFDFGVTGSS